MVTLRTRRFLRVKLDMVTRCQLRCVMCHFAHPEFVENPVTMDRALLERVAAELFPRAHDVVLSSSAEPLLAAELPRALELCAEYGVPSFHFSTNALAMNDRIMDAVLKSQMPLLTISCDGATKQTFEKIRKPASWERLNNRIALIRDRKRAAGSRYPILGLTSVLMRDNIREMPQLVRQAKEWGVDTINFVHMTVIGGLGVEDQTLLNDAKLCNDTLDEVRELAHELGIQAMIPMPIPENLAGGETITDAPKSSAGAGQAIEGPAAPPETSFSVADFLNHKNREFLLAVPPKQQHRRMCYFPWFYMHVNPDGTTFPCGCWYEFSTFGSLRTQSFREIWTGEKYKELRRQHLDLELREVCANCSVANMGRPDVLSSFSQRAKIRRDKRSEAPRA